MNAFLKKNHVWLILAPVLLTILGAASNQAVLIANHGKFPVMLNEKQESVLEEKHEKEAAAEEKPKADANENVKGFRISNTSIGTDEIKNGQFLDNVHSVMGPNSRLKALADVFNLRNIYSVGDFLIIGSNFFFPYLVLVFLGLHALRYQSLQRVAYFAFGLAAFKGAVALIDDATLESLQLVATSCIVAYGVYLLGKALASAKDAQK